ncbi:hypothetical protein [Kitasatospora sp. NPDC088134]|uniref:hypothetical protein n=1 Tax=Kitasatospora sp. NPDC088134 TaxID=3364071 RepID=UPI0037F497B0
MALATAGGTAVVQAAGTQAWEGLRARVARLLGRGDAERERVELERLERTADALDASGGAGAGAERVRLRQETSWQTRFEDLLEGADGADRERIAAELRALVREQGAGAVSAGDHGVAVGGKVEVRADHGSVAALRTGDVTIGNPTRPGPPQG